MSAYKIVYIGGAGEIVEKKSRFIAALKPVNSEEEAVEFVEEIKKSNWNATHNCSAIVVGEHNELTRCSDDGEPSGTAGRPMLEVLLGEGIHNVAVVVTRYFGGTLLGTGGLVRAYQAAVKEGLKECVIIDKNEGYKYEIGTDYNGIGKIQYILANMGIFTIDTEYSDVVKVKIIVPVELENKLVSEITEGTNGRAQITKGEKIYYGIHNNKLIHLA